VTSRQGLAAAIADAKAAPDGGGPVVIHVETDPSVSAPDSDSWWDVPVSEASSLRSTQEARTAYEGHRSSQRTYLSPVDAGGAGRR